jgi:hypothetical protein
MYAYRNILILLEKSNGSSKTQRENATRKKIVYIALENGI